MLVVAAVAGCAEAPKADSSAERTVLVTHAKASDPGSAILIGTARASAPHIVATEPGGRVVRLLADVGDNVRAGQPLAILDGAPAGLRQAAAQARVKRLTVQADERRRNADRVEALVAAGSGTAAELDAARSEARATIEALAEARAEAKLAARTAGMMVVRAPATGTITARPAMLSAEVAPGATLFELQAQRSAIEIIAPLAENVAAGFRIGATVRFASEGRSGSAILQAVSARGTALGTREARFRVTQGAVTPGAAVEIRLMAGGASAMLVPVDALVARADGSRAVRWVDEQSRVREAPVALQRLTAQGALVVGAISPDVAIIAAGAVFVAPGARVHPRPLN